MCMACGEAVHAECTEHVQLSCWWSADRASEGELAIHGVSRMGALQRFLAHLLITEAFVHLALAGKSCPLLL